MSAGLVILGIILTLVFGYLWLLIHEFSHLAAVKVFASLKEWSMKPYPHWGDYGFRFASVQWTYGDDVPTGDELAMIHLAPRFSNLVAAVLLPLILLAVGHIPIAALIFTVFCGCGLVDFAVGSLGISRGSDLRKAAKVWDISPWWIRIIGFLFILVSVISAILIFLL